MNIWLGWLPHRPSMCVFEVESAGFVVQTKKEEVALRWNQAIIEEKFAGIAMSRRLSVKYSDAKVVDLEHAVPVACEVLYSLADMDTISQNGAVFQGEDLLMSGMQHASSALGIALEEPHLRLSEAMEEEENEFATACMNRLAQMLEKRAPGVSTDRRRASEIYMRAIDECDNEQVEAINNLENLLDRGQGSEGPGPATIVDQYVRAVGMEEKESAREKLIELFEQNEAENEVSSDESEE